jgi:hypothetical protein
LASKLYPFAVGNALSSSFKLILVSEGFTAGQRNDFGGICQSFLETFLATTPFNVTRRNASWLTVIKVFVASTASGPSPGSAFNPAMALGTYIDLATNRLVVDHARLKLVLGQQTLTLESGEQTLESLYGSGGISFGVTGGLIGVITPAVATPAGGADAHVKPSLPEEYHLVATTANGLWHQVILRGIGTALGLADEYELSGPDFAAATEETELLLNSPNVVFSAVAPVMNSDFLRWQHVMSPVEWLAPSVVHGHPPNDLPVTSLPAAPYQQGGIAFWEGAAGYRRKAYRSAEDCLMRRAPGMGYLPARGQRTSFCPVCLSHIRSVIS